MRRWILNEVKGGNEKRVFVSDNDLLKIISNDLEEIHPNDRSDYRYLSLHNLHNLPKEIESKEDLKIYDAYFEKVRNGYES